MKPLITIAAIVVLGVLATAAYIRLAPGDPGCWHVDPLQVAKPAFPGHYLIRPEGGDAAGPVFAVPPERLLAELDAIATAAPRVRRIAGSVAEGHVTYVARSAIMGFPDYVSVRAVSAGAGRARLAAFSRLRFGWDDMGVNRDRLTGWLAALQERLPVAG